MATAEDQKGDLKVGDTAPAFQGVDAEGNPWKSEDYVGKYFIVVYFYPGDFTPGCTKQAQVFRDNMNKLTRKGLWSWESAAIPLPLTSCSRKPRN